MGVLDAGWHPLLLCSADGGLTLGQVSAYLRKVEGGHGHWCPGCNEMHVIPDSRTFDGNLEKPTFDPSVKITGKKRVFVDGEWNGEWVRDAEGKAVDMCCHYFLHGGRLEFCFDCTHELNGQTVDLPALPSHLSDEGERG